MKKNEDHFVFSLKKTKFLRKGLILLAGLLFCLPYLTFAQQQRVSITVNNADIQEVFRIIKKQTKLNFIYDADQMKSMPPVTVDLKNATVKEVLSSVFKNTQFDYSIDKSSIIIKKKAMDLGNVETKVVKGQVFDKDGNQLPGVTVVLKGTVAGVATDADGKFAIPLPLPLNKNLLLFSYIGMKTQEVKVKNEKPLSVCMEEEVNAMDEVIVNGIYTTNKNSYTGSVSSIKQEDILAVSQTNLFQALVTLVPGMRIIENNEEGSNPNHVPELLIRGTTSIATKGETGLNTPLIMVDGVETSLEALYDMDIFDIERVDVLKDASATAIYGDRAANGVIVVERKKVRDSKLRLRYNFVPDFGFPDVSCYDLCNPMEKLILEDRFGLYDDAQGRKEEIYYEKLKRINSGVNTDWKSIPLRNSFSHNHSLTATGRGGGMDYSVTLRFGDKYGVMRGDYRRNYNLGFYFSYRLLNKLSISFRGDFTKTDSKNSPYGNFSQWVVLNPYDSPYDEYGELLPELSYETPNPMYNATTGSFMKTKMNMIMASLSMRWDIWKGFYVTGTASLSKSDFKMDNYVSALHTSSLKQGSMLEKGAYDLDASESTNWSVRGNITYSKAFDEKGTLLSVNAGAEARSTDQESYGLSAKGFLKPTMNFLSFANSYAGNAPRGSNQYQAQVSVYGNANFILWNRYFVDASYRSGANSVLGDNERWTPYWSWGIGWNVHNENFIKNNIDWMNIFRIRASLGYVGSGNFDGNMTHVIYSYGGNYITGLGALPGTLGNPDLKAQRTLSYNLGFNLSAFKERFEVNFDLYKQVSKDLLLPIGLPLSTGAAEVYANLGESENWGYELAISGMIIKTRDWLWRMSFNTHHTENKITKISNSLKAQNEEHMKDKGIVPKVQFEEGQSGDAIYAVPSWGINPANGREVFVRPDGTITDDFHIEDKVAVATKTPKLEGSMSTAIAWKNLSMNIVWSYTFGGHIYNATRAAKVENITPEENVDRRAFTERWLKPGDVVAYPLYQRDLPPVHSTRFVEKRNEIYVSNININYNLPMKWVKKMGLKRLALGVGFSDILRISTVKFERGTSYPYMRGINFMISPTF